jgi:hypothetical protein
MKVLVLGCGEMGQEGKNFAWHLFSVVDKSKLRLYYINYE